MSENNEEGPPLEPGGPALLIRIELADRLRIHPSTVDIWREKYGLPAIEKGNKVYFDWADVTAWLKREPQKARRQKRARRVGAKRKCKAGGNGNISGKELKLAERDGAAKERRAEA